MIETESEFTGKYMGDCVFAAVHMGAHRLNPFGWPLTPALLNQLTSEAIAANIGVGPEGQADPAQLKSMLAAWRIVYSIGYDYNGAPITAGHLQTILDGALARGKPVVLGFTNGQALTGDELHLHGHEIVVLHPLAEGHEFGYPCGDGDNPLCAGGRLVYYPLATLAAALPDSAYILEEAPSRMLEITQVAAYFTETALADKTVKWTCRVAGHAFDIHHALLDFFRSLYLPPAGFLGLPLNNAATLPERVAGAGLCYEQHFERIGIRYDPARQYDNPPGVSGACYLIHLEQAYAPPAKPVDAAIAARAAAFEQIKTALAIS